MADNEGVDVTNSTCSVLDCERASTARGWCLMHYKRWRKWGSPTVGKPTELERFWAKVDQSPGPEGCWTWTSTRNHRGYGLFRVATDKQVSAHRYSYQLVNGPIVDGSFVCHTCDNPPCVNPAHLWSGSQSDNMQDRNRKGRTRNQWTGRLGAAS